MIDSPRLLAIAILLPLLGGCAVSGTAVDVVTLPVKAASAGVDAVTTSQSEADQKRGRQIREAEEARGRQLRQLEERCRKRRPLPSDDCTSFQRR